MAKRDYEGMSSLELRRKAVESYLDQMMLAYESVLGNTPKTREIIAMKELDYTDPFQKEIGERWVEEN